MQNNRFERGPLLNKDGLLNDIGYDFSRSKEYVRNDIKAKEIRIKEEDVYTIMNDKFVFKIKLINLTNHKLIIINFNDFLSNEKLEKIIRINKNEQFILPASSLIGVINYKAKGIRIGGRYHILQHIQFTCFQIYRVYPNAIEPSSHKHIMLKP